MSTRQIIIILFCLISVSFPLSGCAELIGGFVAGYMQSDPPSTVCHPSFLQSCRNGQNSSPPPEIAYTAPKRPIYASQLPTIVHIYEEHDEVIVDVSLPSGSKAEIRPGSKGRVYTIDENDNTESLIADIEVTRLTDNGIIDARRTNGSKTIKIKDGDVVRFGDY